MTHWDRIACLVAPPTTSLSQGNTDLAGWLTSSLMPPILAFIGRSIADCRALGPDKRELDPLLPDRLCLGRSPGGDDHFRAFRQWGSPSRTTTPLWTRPRISIPAFSVVLSSGSSPPFFSLRSIDEQRGTLNQCQDRLHPRLSKQERPAADSRESTRTIQARRVVQAEGDGPPKCLGRALSKREEPGADERE